MSAPYTCSYPARNNLTNLNDYTDRRLPFFTPK